MTPVRGVFKLVSEGTQNPEGPPGTLIHVTRRGYPPPTLIPSTSCVGPGTFARHSARQDNVTQRDGGRQRGWESGKDEVIREEGGLSSPH